MKKFLGLLMAVMILFGASAFAADTKSTAKAEANVAVKKEIVKQKRHHHHRRHHRHHRHHRRMMKK